MANLEYNSTIVTQISETSTIVTEISETSTIVTEINADSIIVGIGDLEPSGIGYMIIEETFIIS